MKYVALVLFVLRNFVGSMLTNQSFLFVLVCFCRGEYWGEMGSFRIEMGKNILGIEEKCTWATPATFTTINYPCDEDGANCGPTTKTYVDPSDDVTSVQERLQLCKKERMSVK